MEREQTPDVDEQAPEAAQEETVQPADVDEQDDGAEADEDGA